MDDNRVLNSKLSDNEGLFFVSLYLNIVLVSRVAQLSCIHSCIWQSFYLLFREEKRKTEETKFFLSPRFNETRKIQDAYKKW